MTDRAAGRAARLICGAIALIAAFGFFAASIAPARAQELSLIRDVETEALIAEYTAPIFKVAGLSGQNIKVHLVNDTSFNAFVVNGQHMFINTGAILLSETPNQLIGVIAHETGHIKGGHLTARRQLIEKMQTAALMLQALSLGAVVGGAVSGSHDTAQAGSALMFGGQQILMRSILSYARAQESAADQAGVTFLTATKQSPSGMLKTFRYFADQQLASAGLIDPYIQTHPVAGDRIAQLEEISKRSPYFNEKDSAQLQLKHDLVRAKIAAYTYRNNPQRVLRQYADNSLPARYARAIVKFHTGGYQAAASALDELISASPNNPWFYELKGTFLVESGRGQEAVAPLRKAVSLYPKSGYLRIELAQALLEGPKGVHAEEALEMLQKALIDEDESYLGYRLKAQALANLGRRGEADLASAQASFHKGDLPHAKLLAERAKQGLAPYSAGWIKAEDILNFNPPKVRS